MTEIYSQTFEELNYKANEFRKKGDLQNSLRYAKLALDEAEKRYGNKSEKYATSLNTLALIYKSMSLYSKAEPLYKEALEIRKEILKEQRIIPKGFNLNNHR